MFSVLQNLFSDLPALLIRIPVILLALCVHETAHGWAANKLGDPTARNLGRLTLNPLKHLDPIGTICMLLFGFGWARPVPIMTRNFKNPKRDMALSAAAGPLSNILLAFLGLLSVSLFEKALMMGGILTEYAGALYYTTDNHFLINLITYTHLFFFLFYRLNLSLAVFNLLPVPPLDGSRIWFSFLPARLYFKVMQYEQIIQVILMVALWTGMLDKPLQFLVSLVAGGMEWLIGLFL